jgi:hypothetical protein
VVVKEETVAQLDARPHMQWKQIDNNLKIKNIKNSKSKADRQNAGCRCVVVKERSQLDDGPARKLRSTTISSDLST